MAAINRKTFHGIAMMRWSIIEDGGGALIVDMGKRLCQFVDKIAQEVEKHPSSFNNWAVDQLWQS